MNWSIFLSTIVAIGALVLSFIKMIRQLRQQSRLSYVTTLLTHKNICEQYQAFLLDLRFVWNALSIFPIFQVNEQSIKDAMNDKDKLIIMNHMVQYMKDAFHGAENVGNLHLRELCPRLSSELLDYKESADILFENENWEDIEKLFNEINMAIGFNPGKSWFLSLFAHSASIQTRLCQYLIHGELQSRQDEIANIENQIRLFLIADKKTYDRH